MTDKPKPDLVTYDGVPLTEGQIMMLEDGCPRELLLPDDARRQSWKGVRARPIMQMTFAKPKTKDEDPATTALRKEVEATARKKQDERLQRLKELKMAKAGPKELQVRAMRETNAAPAKKTKTAPAPAATQPKPETPAPTTKETTVKTGTGKQKTRKGGPKKAAKAKAAPAKKSAGKAAAKQKARTPVAQAGAAKPWRDGTIGAVAREAILAGRTNDEALAAVKAKFPDGETNLGNMAWYRNDLRSRGFLKAEA